MGCKIGFFTALWYTASVHVTPPHNHPVTRPLRVIPHLLVYGVTSTTLHRASLSLLLIHHGLDRVRNRSNRAPESSGSGLNGNIFCYKNTRCGPNRGHLGRTLHEPSYRKVSAQHPVEGHLGSGRDGRPLEGRGSTRRFLTHISVRAVSLQPGNGMYKFYYSKTCDVRERGEKTRLNKDITAIRRTADEGRHKSTAVPGRELISSHLFLLLSCLAQCRWRWSNRRRTQDRGHTREAADFRERVGTKEQRET